MTEADLKGWRKLARAEMDRWRNLYGEKIHVILPREDVAKRREAVLRMRREGLTMKDIAKRLSTSQATIQRDARELQRAIQ